MATAAITREETEKIRNSPIEKPLEDRLQPGAGIIAEKVDYGPGDPLKDYDFTILYKLGSGARGHVYAGIWTAIPGVDSTPVVKACLPYASRKHYLELLLREEREKALDMNKYGDYIEKTLAPLIDRLKEEIKYTNPVHNNDELRQLSGSPVFHKSVLKFLSNEMMAKDPEAEKELIKEATILAKVNHPSIPKFIRFVRTDKGIGYLAGFVDGRTWGELMEDEWWKRAEDGKYLEHLPEKVVIAKFAEFYGGLSHMHKNGVLYYDIQPGNIMSDLAGAENFIDFGFTEEMLPGKTTIESAGGNEDFIPPEIIAHLEEDRKEGKSYGYRIKEGRELPLDPKSNVWSAGVLAWWLIAGGQDMPFKGHPFPRLVDSITKHKHVDPRIYHGKKREYSNKTIDLLVNLPLKKDPKDRPHSGYIYRELLKMLGDESPDEISRNWYNALRKMREESFKNPESASLETPKKHVLKKQSVPFRRRPSPQQ